MTFIKELPDKPSFSQKGLDGFKYLLQNKKVDINIVEVHQGHDNYIISKKCTHFYYILEGTGEFDVKGEKYQVNPGMLIEIPTEIEYTYSGKMKILLITEPPWFEGNEKMTKPNQDIK